MSNQDTITVHSGGTDSLTVPETVTLDLGDYNTYSYSSSLSSAGFSAISIDDLPSIGSVSLPATGSYVLSTSGGGGAGSYSTAWTTTGTSYNPTSKNVHIDADGLTMREGADIKIGSKSLTESIEKIEERLGILNPNPELEDRWEKLKDLRKQYVELEKDLLEKEKIMKILKET